jgi:hypothetical protein
MEKYIVIIPRPWASHEIGTYSLSCALEYFRNLREPYAKLYRHDRTSERNLIAWIGYPDPVYADVSLHIKNNY